MKYELGILDSYLIEAAGTPTENEPMLKVAMKENIDHVRLEDAVYRAIKFHPLFGTQVGFDRTYFLETNNRPLKLIHAKESERPLQFGRSTNGYPWQLCWSGKELTFEWSHGVTDANGALDFLRTILSMYCGIEFPNVPRKVDLGLGFEPFIDRKQKGKDIMKQPAGFRPGAIPHYKRGYKTDCYTISGSTAQLLSVSKACGSSPAAVLTLLLAKAIRMQLPENLSNKNVATNLALDLRKPFLYETMHNCVEFMRVTYQDKHEEMGFAAAARDLKAIMDNARVYENSVKTVTDRVKELSLINLLPGKKARREAVRLVGQFYKELTCNCELTYLGQCKFPKEVLEQVEDLHFRVWHDFGECIISAIDFAGTFNIDFSVNYLDQHVVEDFLALCHENGLDFALTGKQIYIQAGFVEETEKEIPTGRGFYGEKEILTGNMEPQPGTI